jgi:hypothetical protein
MRATLLLTGKKNARKWESDCRWRTHSHTLMQHLVQQLAVEILRRGGMRCDANNKKSIHASTCHQHCVIFRYNPAARRIMPSICPACAPLKFKTATPHLRPSASFPAHSIILGWHFLFLEAICAVKMCK